MKLKRSTVWFGSLLFILFSSIHFYVLTGWGKEVSTAELDAESRDALAKANRPDHITPEDWDRIIRRYKLAMIQNTDILYFGKVVDSSSAPVAGAKVSGLVKSFNPQYILHFEKGSEDTRNIEWAATTDTNGLFTVRGMRGLTLEVSRIEKAGYFGRNIQELFQMSPRDGFTKVHNANSEDPFAFMIWPDSGEEVSLVQKKFRFVGLADGRIHRFNLEKDGIVNDESSSFDLSVVVKSEKSLGGPQAKYDWEFKVVASDGGIVEAAGASPFAAPDDGYQQSIEYQNSKTVTPWRRSVSQSYFVRGRGGQMHAIVDLSLICYHDGTTSVRLESKANLTGSRILMPREKIIR